MSTVANVFKVKMNKEYRACAQFRRKEHALDWARLMSSGDSIVYWVYDARPPVVTLLAVYYRGEIHGTDFVPPKDMD